MKIKATVFHQCIQRSLTGSKDKETTNQQELRLKKRERNRQTGPAPRETPPRTPSAPEDWADDNTDTVGELPDDPSQDSAEDLIEKLFGTLTDSIEVKSSKRLHE